MADIDHEIREVFGIIARLLNAGQMPGIAHQLKMGSLGVKAVPYRF